MKKSTSHSRFTLACIIALLLSNSILAGDRKLDARIWFIAKTANTDPININGEEALNLFTVEAPTKLSELELSLAEFSVVQSFNKVEIKWSVLHEVHTLDYIIEKSKDGKKFSTLIDIHCGANDSSYHEYFETDFHPSSYYRLKIKTDHNTYQYSEVVYIKPTNITHHTIDDIRNSLLETLDKITLDSSEDKKTLVLLRNTEGAEFSTRIHVIKEQNKIYGVEESKQLPSGTYLVIASKNNSLEGHQITIQ